jgi:FkbM family methyltransferase
MGYPLKLRIKRLLQAILGFERYLVVFSIFKILTLPMERTSEGEFNLFLDRLPEDGIAIDAGANIGIMSVLMARRMRRGTIHAFEPIPANFRALERIVGIFGTKNVVVHPIALGDREQEVEMVLPEENAVKLQGYGHVVEDSIQGYPDGQHYHVACQRLDQIEALQADGAKIAGIKIDVEGFEYFVLEGAKSLIARDRPVIYCEVSPSHREESFALFAKLGYRMHIAQDGALVPYDITSNTHWNLFAIPE